MSGFLLRGGTIINSDGRVEADMLLREGRVVKIGKNLSSQPDDEIIDCKGKWLLPGAIDPHTHMGIPIKNGWSADDFASGSRSALHGGVTTILDFTVQEAGQSLTDSVNHRLELAKPSVVDYGLHCNITRFSPEMLEEIPQLIERGITSFKVFTAYEEAGMRLRYDEIRQVAEVVAKFGGLLMVHAEEGEVIGRAMSSMANLDSPDPRLHGASRPVEAEVQAIHRMAEIADQTECLVYVVHLSSGAGFEASKGHRNVLLETCPQYLLLDESVYGREDGRMYVASPPLRKHEDNDALWLAIASGAVHALGTDHCPFNLADKPLNRPFTDIPNGMGGVETLLPVMLAQFIERKLPVERLVELLSTHPAKIFGMYPRKGVLQQGADGDVLVVDPEVLSEVSLDKLESSIDWSAYTGFKAIFPEQVFQKGQLVLDQYSLQQVVPGEFIKSAGMTFSPVDEG